MSAARRQHMHGCGGGGSTAPRHKLAHTAIRPASPTTHHTSVEHSITKLVVFPVYQSAKVSKVEQLFFIYMKLLILRELRSSPLDKKSGGKVLSLRKSAQSSLQGAVQQRTPSAI